MHAAFGIVVIAVSLVALVVAAVALASSGRTFDQIGRGGLSISEDPAPAIQPGERDSEVRQMLGARNARRAARGEPALDVEAELRALAAPAADAGAREELRALVQARNRRRLAAGQEPLDVDAEVSRRLAELGDG